LGIGDWGLGIGDWAQSPIPNPQSPIPNPQYKLNPVLGNIKIGIVFVPYALEDKNGFYRMYVSIRKFGKIAMLLSQDDINWSNLKIVIDKGNYTNWAYITNRTNVIYKDGIYKILYTG
jgi:hypothetical protein